MDLKASNGPAARATGQAAQSQTNGLIILRWGANTSSGPRPENQDYYGVPSSGDQGLQRFGVLLVVCDGVGGSAGGDEAARIAVTETQRSFYSSEGPTISPRERLEWSIQRANQAILRCAAQTGHHQMATTIVAACVFGEHLYIAYAGDSRAYVLRRGRLRLLTTDHSVVAEEANRGLIALSEAEQAKYRNVVTRSLGAVANNQVDHRLETLKPGDRVLLCTDGLYTALSEEEIEHILSQPAPAQRVAEMLVERASLSPRASDNITAAVLDYGVPLVPVGSASRFPVWSSVALGFAVLVAVAVFAWGILGNIETSQNQPRAIHATQQTISLPLSDSGETKTQLEFNEHLPSEVGEEQPKLRTTATLAALSKLPTPTRTARPSAQLQPTPSPRMETAPPSAPTPPLPTAQPPVPPQPPSPPTQAPPTQPPPPQPPSPPTQVPPTQPPPPQPPSPPTQVPPTQPPPPQPPSPPTQAPPTQPPPPQPPSPPTQAPPTQPPPTQPPPGSDPGPGPTPTLPPT